MKSFYLPSRFFKKKWVWFEDPHDIAGADMVTFFSYNSVDAPGFKKSSELTSVIELEAPISEIWERARQQFIRLQVERGRRRGITVECDSPAFEEFRPLYENFRRLKKLPSEPWQPIAQNGMLFVARHESKIMAGMVCIEDGTYMRLWKLASLRLEEGDALGRKIAGEANRLVIWEAIVYAKEHGYRVFDMGGITPESADSGVRAVADFKEAFGGERRAQCYYHKVYSPLLKAWIRVRRSLHI